MGGALHPETGTIGAPIVVIGATGTIGSEIVRALVDAGHPRSRSRPGPRPPGVARPPTAAGHREPPWPRTSTTTAQPPSSPPSSARSAGLWVVWSPLSPLARRRATAQIAAAFSTSRPTALRECLDQTVLAQLALARHLIPLLAEAGRNGRYVIIGGPGSEAPWAGYGLRSVAMAATRMLAQVLHGEAQSLGVRVHLRLDRRAVTPRRTRRS